MTVARTDQLRIGLIGCGKMGVQHLRAIAATPGARVIGVADPQADPVLLAKLLPGGVAVVAHAGALFAMKPDILHIVTPPETHKRLALQALNAGSHVYVEKPFTPSVPGAVEILELAERRGLKVCAGHQYLFEAPAIKARELLTQIGRVVHVESFFSFRMVRRTITPVDQAKDILPHAVYPLVEQLRAGSGVAGAQIEITGIDARATGDVYALMRLGDCTGILVVTLTGRPIEQYQKIIGTNGSLRLDYITGAVTHLSGPGTGAGVLLTPYRRAFQTLRGATVGFAKLMLSRRTSYPGLQMLIAQFYASVAAGGRPPLSAGSIVETVSLCERIGHALDKATEEANRAATAKLKAEEGLLPPGDETRGTVLVTGGTGFLGRRVAAEVRAAGLRVRVVARRVPAPTLRVAGVDYVSGDLARPFDGELLRGVRVVAHCAAETAGGKEDHERNSLAATRHVIEAAAAAGVSQVIHVSSLAVLKPRHLLGADPLDEETPVDAGNIERGPYVWGKAESELLAKRLGSELGVAVKVIRPGPLVDYLEFSPPGRLGREVGPWFVAIGGRSTPLSVCDVGTAARVIRSYACDFESAPDLVNLVEAPAPTRGALAKRLRANRPDLRIIWFPAVILRALAGPSKLVQRLLMAKDRPVDVYAAFSSEQYRTARAAVVIERAGHSAQRRSPACDLVGV